MELDSKNLSHLMHVADPREVWTSKAARGAQGDAAALVAPRRGQRCAAVSV